MREVSAWRVVMLVAMLCLSGCTIIIGAKAGFVAAGINERDYEAWTTERGRIGERNARVVVQCERQATATRLRASMLADEAERLRVLATIPDCSDLPAEPLPPAPDEHAPGVWVLVGGALGLAIDVCVVYYLTHTNFFGPRK